MQNRLNKNLLLAIFSGLLLWLGWPPSQYITFLLFVGLVPMLLAMENIIKSAAKNKGRQIFQTTFAGFFVWNTLSVYWIYTSVKAIVGEIIAIPITLIPYCLGPLLMSGACWFYYRMRVSANRNLSLAALVCFWIGYEYIHQTWPLAFPWMTLGNGFAVNHTWVQWYAYTGVYGGTIWIWLINILVFLFYTSLSEAKPAFYRRNVIIVFCVALILPIGISLTQYYAYREHANPSGVVIAQPNIDPYGKEFSIPVYQQVSALTQLSDSLAQPNTEFFIWPETAIPNAVQEDKITGNASYAQAKRFLSKYKNGNIITGAETYKIYNSALTASARPMDGGQYFDSFNSALSIENSDNVQFYHKSKLVPGAEVIPFSSLSFLKPIFARFGGAAGSYGSQPEPGVFHSQSGIGSDPVICYESIWGSYVAQAVKNGAQFIAIITNDGWWENTAGKDQHMEYAKLRAIENRRWVCRSANTGISAFINQRGDVVKQTKWWVRTAIKQDINLNSDLTFYTLHGDYLPKIACFLAIAALIWLATRVRLVPRSRAGVTGRGGE